MKDAGCPAVLIDGAALERVELPQWGTGYDI